MSVGGERVSWRQGWEVETFGIRARGQAPYIQPLVRDAPAALLAKDSRDASPKK